MQVLLFTILTLCALGILSAVILYFVARKFRVEEDPRIDAVEKMLPGANCGAADSPDAGAWPKPWSNATTSRISSARWEAATA